MMTVANGRDTANPPPAYSPAFSTMFQMSSGGDGQQAYAAVFPVMYNFITNGGITWPSNPTVMGGGKFFVADSAQLLASEYNNAPGAVNNAFFVDLPAPPVEVLPQTLWTEKNAEAAASLQAIGLYDLDRKLAWTVPARSQEAPREVDPASGFFRAVFDAPPSRKFPYVCGDDEQKSRDGSDTLFYRFHSVFVVERATTKWVRPMGWPDRVYFFCNQSFFF